MLFNSIEYGLFLILVFSIYWAIPHKYRWALMLTASCVFYMFFIPAYILILFSTILVDYFAGIFIHNSRNEKTKKIILAFSIIVTCLILGFFKYFGFFEQTISDIATLFNLNYHRTVIEIILPIGLSFHTFQSLSYVIEVYRGNQIPERNFGIYSLYVMFFPQLVAGPIERPQNLLYQFHEKKKFNVNLSTDGLRQILWGLFKKIVIADNLANYTDKIFSDYENLPGSSLVIGAFYFSVQIYCDFSGYSDIALGSAKLFGFKLMTNFNYPYFSRNVGEFWRRWHISLSTWFRDYVYFPLGGSKGTLIKVIRNTIIIFTLSGFWHGANWTFVIWGLINAIYFLPLLLSNTNRKHLEIIAQNRLLPNLKELLQMLITFIIVTFAWIFFRAPNLSTSFKYIQNIFSADVFAPPLNAGIKTNILLIFFLFGVEWFQRNKEFALEISSVNSGLIRWGAYLLIAFMIVLFGASQQNFIYFQF